MEQFWFNQPSILLNKAYITNIIPRSNQTLEEKLNAFTRLVICIALFVNVILRGSLKVLYVTLIICTLVILLYKSSKKKQGEPFFSSSPCNELQNMREQISNTRPTPENPMMNVMLPEIKDNPDRPEASRAYCAKVDKEINQSVRSNLDKKLFRNLGDEIDFDTSMRQFYTTPNTLIPNDQAGFAEFCFGN